MEYVSKVPRPPLDGLIDDLYYLEGAPPYADGCVVTMPTRALEFGYPLWTRSVGVHFKPWGLAPFLPMPAAELCDRPVTILPAWGWSAIRAASSRRPARRSRSAT